MSVDEMKEAVKVIDGSAQTECSGNVTKEKVKDLIDELASDGEISEQDLKTILNMQAELKDEDLTNTVDKEIAKLGDMDEKEITQEVAIKFATKVDSGADFEQYIEELTGSKELAVDIKIAMQTNDLDLLKSELNDLPPEYPFPLSAHTI